MSFILTCIFIYLLFVLLRPVFAWAFRRFVQWQTRRFFNNVYRQTSQAYGGGESRRPGGGRKSSSGHRRKKVFDRNDGEYVEFEEISYERENSGDSGRYVTEDQVTDAEWTEIK